jgi:predicted membrane protein
MTHFKLFIFIIVIIVITIIVTSLFHLSKGLLGTKD